MSRPRASRWRSLWAGFRSSSPRQHGGPGRRQPREGCRRGRPRAKGPRTTPSGNEGARSELRPGLMRLDTAYETNETGSIRAPRRAPPSSPRRRLRRPASATDGIERLVDECGRRKASAGVFGLRGYVKGEPQGSGGGCIELVRGSWSKSANHCFCSGWTFCRGLPFGGGIPPKAWSRWPRVWIDASMPVSAP